MRYKSYDENTIGTDYVCGDIHGCYDQLKHQLTVIGFNTITDRLFVCGDLVDRGTHHHRMMEFCDSDWFIPILGNHEIFLLNATTNPDEYPEIDRKIMEQSIRNDKQFWYDEGGLWWEDCHPLYQNRIRDYISKLPLIIDIKIQDKLVGLVHAQIDNSWEELKTKISTLPTRMFYWFHTEAARYSDQYDLSYYIEQRQKYKLSKHLDNIKNIPDIDLVIHGHTIVDNPYRIGNCVLIDHGSYIKSGQIADNIEFDPYGFRIHKLSELLL